MPICLAEIIVFEEEENLNINVWFYFHTGVESSIFKSRLGRLKSTVVIFCKEVGFVVTLYVLQIIRFKKTNILGLADVFHYHNSKRSSRYIQIYFL